MIPRKCEICGATGDTMFIALPSRWSKKLHKSHGELCFECGMACEGHWQTGEVYEPRLIKRENA
jgi:hypothetical protein